MKKLGIILDSFSGLKKSEYEKLGFEYINQTLILDGESFKEGIDGTLELLVSKIEAAKEHKTSMPAIGIITQKYEEITDKYEEIIFMPMSSGISSTFSVSTTAANDFKNIHVVDTKFAGHASIYVAKEAIKMYEGGKSIKEIIKFIKDKSKNSYTYVLPSSVAQLIKGGRLAGAKKTIMEKGKLIPRLYLSETGFKTKGIKRNFAKAVGSSIDKVLAEISNKDDFIWEIVHTSGKKYIDIAKKEFDERGIKYDVIPASASTAAHTGAGAIGINAYKK